MDNTLANLRCNTSSPLFCISVLFRVAAVNILAPNSRLKADPAQRAPGPRKRESGAREKTKALAVESGRKWEVTRNSRPQEAGLSTVWTLLNRAGNRYPSLTYLCFRIPRFPRRSKGWGWSEGGGGQPVARVTDVAASLRSHMMQAGHVASGRGGTAVCIFSPPRAQVRVVVA